jgi:tetratricopeptide (TPR) repeat protein
MRGVIAAEMGDEKNLGAMVDFIAQKIEKAGTNATNFSSIYKFFIHLKILEGLLAEDQESIMQYIGEGKRIKKKMGSRTSMFDLSYFFNTYAEILMKLGKNEEALTLLDDVVQYNPHYAAARLNRSKILFDHGDIEKGKEEFLAAGNLLAEADLDYTLVQEMEELRLKLGVSSR